MVGLPKVKDVNEFHENDDGITGDTRDKISTEQLEKAANIQTEVNKSTWKSIIAHWFQTLLENTGANLNTLYEIPDGPSQTERDSNPKLQRQKAIDRQYSNTFSTIEQVASNQENQRDQFELERCEANKMFIENNAQEDMESCVRSKQLKHSSLEIYSLDDLGIA